MKEDLYFLFCSMFFGAVAIVGTALLANILF